MIPDVGELQSIVDYEHEGPAVTAAFHNGAGCPGCTDVTLVSCSCTRSDAYWSSTRRRRSPDLVWGLSFFAGNATDFSDKNDSFAVRAVRGGL